MIREIAKTVIFFVVIAASTYFVVTGLLEIGAAVGNLQCQAVRHG